MVTAETWNLKGCMLQVKVVITEMLLLFISDGNVSCKENY